MRNSLEEGEVDVPRGTLALLTYYDSRQYVPRETSCIRNLCLLSFRLRGNLGENYRDCQSKRRRRKDYDVDQSSRRHRAEEKENPAN